MGVRVRNVSCRTLSSGKGSHWDDHYLGARCIQDRCTRFSKGCDQRMTDLDNEKL